MDDRDSGIRRRASSSTSRAEEESKSVPYSSDRKGKTKVTESDAELQKSSSPSSSASLPPSEAGAPEGITWGLAFVVLLFVRHFSSKSNIIHDCDEVFNYWEPLHYIFYKSGFQTWEYSSEFALRSYLYLLLHAIFAAPLKWWYGDGPGKVHLFYGVRFFLGTLSAATEAALVSAISKRYGKRLAAYTLMILCFSTGCFNASTGLLPSSFCMYAITLATSFSISKRPYMAVVASVVGVLIGWPFSVLATVPVVMHSFFTGTFAKTMLAGLASSICILIPSILVDKLFYGKWTISVFNLVFYNVFGGGDSALYGVESPTFYIRNGFNNFNFAFLLALLLPFMIFITKKKAYHSLLVFVSPLYIWLIFMSLQPHKEERFLYPVYTLICVSAAAFIEIIPEILPKYKQDASESSLFMALKILRPVILGLIIMTSYSRSTALLNAYTAPMKIYSYLPRQNIQKDVNLCIGSEWHRFPSSFFLPSPSYKVKWLDDGFRGLLPLPFNTSIGGSAASPPYFNKLNKASPAQYITDVNTCDFLVELDLHRENFQLRGSNETEWEVIVQVPYLDNERSPALHRAFFIPWAWQSSNKFGTYRLLRRRESNIN